MEKVTLVGNVMAVERLGTHTSYTLDDAMGKPVTVRVWKVVSGVRMEENEIRCVAERFRKMCRSLSA